MGIAHPTIALILIGWGPGPSQWAHRKVNLPDSNLLWVKKGRERLQSTWPTKQVLFGLASLLS